MEAADARVQQAVDEKNKYHEYYLLQKLNNRRNTDLFKKNVISKEELDASNEALHSSLANKRAAEANLLALHAQQNKAHWVVKQKTINSPIKARVFETYYSEHEKIIESRPVMSLLAPAATKIIFFIPEPKLARLQINQKLDVFVDGRKQPFHAKISYISPKAEYTPPVIFSEAQRQMLVFRVEAEPIKQKNSLIIHPGQPVTVIISHDEISSNDHD